MNRRSLSVLFVLTILPLQYAQAADPDGFTFKGHSLGMLLNDFKVLHVQEHVSVPFGTVNAKKKNVTVYRPVSLPICSDDWPNAPVFDGMLIPPGEIVCEMAWNRLGLMGVETVGGTTVGAIAYRFWSGRLYGLDFLIRTSSFNTIADAFARKYGKPATADTDTIQNIYGARWTGRRLGWASGTQSILLVEGDGNGPGRDGWELSGIVMIEDSSFRPPDRAPAPPDF